MSKLHFVYGGLDSGLRPERYQVREHWRMNFTVGHVNLAKGFRGGERQTELLIKHLAAEFDLSQVLVCRKDSPLVEHLAGLNGLQFVFPASRLASHWQLPCRVDLFHAHEPKGMHWTWVEHLLRRTPYLITRRVTHQIAKNFFNELCYGKAMYVVAISQAVNEILKKMGINHTAVVHSSYTGMDGDLSKAEIIKKKYKGKFIVGHIGALVDKHKGQREIIKAASKISKKYDDIIFLMLGDGPDRNLLIKESSGLNNIVFEGFVNNVNDYICAMDLFVFPSRYEGLGSVLLDVMYHGVPIIATAVDGICDLIVSGSSGILIPPNDAGALADKIELLYRNKDMRESISENARRNLKRFSPAQMAATYFDLYKKCLNVSDKESVGANL